MMKRFAEGASRIFLACVFTDFRKQIPGLVATVTLNFKLDPYNSSYVFIFCNRRKDSIKVLRYDYNGFVLATKNFWMAGRMASSGIGNRTEKSTSPGKN